MSLYLTSTDPEVIAVVEANTSGRQAFREEAWAWAEAHGADGYFPSSFVGSWSVVGLPDDADPAKLPGRWTKPARGCIKPFRSNTDELEAMRAIRFDEAEVPGLPSTLDSVTDPDGRHYLMYPTPILQDGSVWVCYSHHPAPGEAEKVGPQWQECLASAYHAAREAYFGHYHQGGGAL